MSKRILQHPEEPTTGTKYWRSLEQLAETPESKRWQEREFQTGASELNPEVGRRDFVKYMAASAALAGLSLSACRREQKNLVPFSQGVEWSVPGKPVFYATSRPHRRGAQPVVVATYDGRPTKVEGNPAHPMSKGASNTHCQTSLLDLYDPDRSHIFQLEGVKSDEAAFMKWVQEEVLAKAGDGTGIAFLSENFTSPTLNALQKRLLEKLPNALWATYEPLNTDEVRTAASAAFGNNVVPAPQLDKADVILALDSNFLGSDEGRTDLTRAFAARRKPEQKMNRLYVVENHYSTTGGMADHRLRVKVSQVGLVALAIAERIVALTNDEGLTQVLGKFAPGKSKWSEEAGKLGEKASEWITEAAKDLVAQKGKALVLVGYRQPAAVQGLGHAINSALESFGEVSSGAGATLLGRRTSTVETKGILDLAIALGHETPEAKKARIEATQKENQERAKTGEPALPIVDAVRRPSKIKTLFILGGNPIYNAPADLKLAELVRGVAVVRHGYYEDESTYTITGNDTRRWVKWHVPAAHYLEAWGDGIAGDGSLVAQQPMILPLFGGWSEIQLLNFLIAGAKAEGMELVQETFKAVTGGLDATSWTKFLHDGFFAAPADTVRLQVNPPMLARLATKYVAPQGEMEVVFTHCPKVDDGRYSNNAWLQELPDPITKLTWDNAALISPATARKLGLAAKQGNGIFEFENGAWLMIDAGGRSLQIPALIVPGHADDSVTIALGYGHEHEGRVGGRTGNFMSHGGFAQKHGQVGFNAYPLRTMGTMYFHAGASVSKFDFASLTDSQKSESELYSSPYKLAITQEHGALEGRGVDIIREGTAEDFKESPGFPKDHHWLLEREAMDAHAEKTDKNGFPEPRSFYTHPADSRDKNEKRAYNDPLHQWAMAIDLSVCTGCSACMVACQAENNIAVVGKEQVIEGRELHWIRMDRYFATPMNSRKDKVVDLDNPRMVVQPMPCQHCENAPCETVCPVNATVHSDDGLNIMAYNRCIGTRYCANNCPFKVRRFNFFDFNERQKENYHRPNILSPRSMPETLKMSKNPNVTVRMRGVMEKCTFCVQRVEEAKIAAKVKAKDSDDVRIPTDSFQVACQQVCSSGAITFGNMLDPKSMVAKDVANPRTYRLLDYIGVKPRVHYLARIMNPNPKMPDKPFDEYEKAHAQPSAEGKPVEKVAMEKADKPKGVHP